MNIVCGNCKKDSGVAYSGRIGSDAAKVQHEANFVVKLPVLFGVSEWFFACSKECMQVILDAKFKTHGVTEETKAEAKQITDDFKAKIPQYSKQTCEFMGKVQNFLILLKKENGKR